MVTKIRKRCLRNRMAYQKRKLQMGIAEQSFRPESAEMNSLQIVAESTGFELINVFGDGDSLFEAISIVLKKRHKICYEKTEIRRLLSQYLQVHPYINKDDMKDVIDALFIRLGLQTYEKDLAWNIYAHKISLPFCEGGVWGDEIALQGLSELLNLNITIYDQRALCVQQYGPDKPFDVALGLISDTGDVKIERGDRIGPHYCAIVKKTASPPQHRKSSKPTGEVIDSDTRKRKLERLWRMRSSEPISDKERGKRRASERLAYRAICANEEQQQVESCSQSLSAVSHRQCQESTAAHKKQLQPTSTTTRFNFSQHVRAQGNLEESAIKVESGDGCFFPCLRFGKAFQVRIDVENHECDALGPMVDDLAVVPDNVCAECGTKFQFPNDLTQHIRTGCDKLHQLEDCSPDPDSVRPHEPGSTAFIICPSLCDAKQEVDVDEAGTSGSLQAPDDIETAQDHHCDELGETYFSFSCGCGRTFADNDRLLEHMQVMHPVVQPIVVEPVAGPSSSSGKQMEVVRSLQQEPLNDNSTRRQSQLTSSGVTTSRHLQRQKTAAHHLFVCDDCGQCLSSEVRLQKHRGYHTGERPFKCDRCGTSFVTKGTLQAHVFMDRCSFEKSVFFSRTKKKITNEINADKQQVFVWDKQSQNFVCEQCGIRMGSQKRMEMHYGYHTGARPFLCDSCGASYVTKGTLQIHVTKNRCSYPKKSLTHVTSGAQESVIKVEPHSGSPFPCLLCGGTFSDQVYLENHECQGVDDDVCKECGTKFQYPDDLASHMLGCNLLEGDAESKEHKYSDCHSVNNEEMSDSQQSFVVASWPWKMKQEADC